jgi:hypothetical protein
MILQGLPKRLLTGPHNAAEHYFLNVRQLYLHQGRLSNRVTAGVLQQAAQLLHVDAAVAAYWKDDIPSSGYITSYHANKVVTD